MRRIACFPIDDPAFWKVQLLHWTAGFETGIYLDSNTLATSGTRAGFECMAATEAMDILTAEAGSAFPQLKNFLKEDWCFGYFSYDLKNEVEQLQSRNFDGVGLPDLGFFRPETVAILKAAPAEISASAFVLEIQCVHKAPEQVFESIRQVKNPDASHKDSRLVLSPRISKAAYLQTVETIREHIAGGDIYELNFCQEFFAEQAEIDPLSVFKRLNNIGKAPFSTFLRWKDTYLLSASPERFLKKNGRQLITQPIKGTRRRGKTAAEDEAIRQELAASEKDRSENVMIVDLVRNDFSRNCIPGSVQVEELCGIYSFATVHQMISTISGVLPSGISGLDALRDAFPMGSMTGAPKVMAMELIEQYERSRRGLYSGAVGYFTPDGDFDFNVVIRSILYHAKRQYVSAQVGGAIVYDSVPEEEYEECLVKAAAMMRALGDLG